MGEKRNAYRLVVRNPEEKRPLGKPRRRCTDNIKMYLLEKRLGDVDWIGLAQDREKWRALLNALMNFRVPYNAGKLPSGCTTYDISSGAQVSLGMSSKNKNIRAAASLYYALKYITNKLYTHTSLS
jgi:hypothetical protein